MPRNPLHDVAIVAFHNTQQARSLDIDEGELLTSAMRAALDEAGLKPKDIDGVSMNGWTQNLTALHAIDWLGGHPCWFDNHYPGITCIMAAASAIATGQCHTVMLSAAQSGAYQVRSNVAPWTRPDYEFSACWGMMTPAQFALVAKRHMHEYGTTVEAFAEVASVIRTNGSKHPQAVYYGKPVSREDVLNSRMIAEPFRLLDCATTSEGGTAMILTTRERAKDMASKPVYILGGALERTGYGYTIPPVWEDCVNTGVNAAKHAFNQSGLTVKDIDFAEFYDPFSYELIRQIEAFGFCKFGEGNDFVLEGNIRLDGSLPIVTNGGTMAFSHPGVAQMIQKAGAVVEQLRGTAPAELQLKNPKIGMATNAGSANLAMDVIILGAEAA